MAGIKSFLRSAWSYVAVIVLAVTCILLIDHYGPRSIWTKAVWPVVVELVALGALARIDSTRRFFHFLNEQLADRNYRAKTIMLLFSIGVIFIIFNFYLLTSSGAWDQQGGPWSFFFSALTGLVTTIFGVTVYDFVVKPFERLLEGQERKDFLDFFGKSCEQDGMTLVFPSRVLDKDRLVQGLEAAGSGENETVRKKMLKNVDAFFEYPFITSELLPPEARKTQPEDVRWWVAYQDVQSAAHLAQLLARVGIKEQVRFELDFERARKGWSKSQVSFGLGYNEMTVMIQKQFHKKPRSGGLSALPFEVDYKHDSPKKRGFWTDNIVYLGVLLEPPEAHDYAIIIRVVHGDERYASFICAGRTACGTTAAGMYLAEHWKDELKGEYEKRKDQREVIDGHAIDLRTHSLFVIVEHKTDDPERGWIAKDPNDASKKLMHFELVSDLLHR